MSRVWFILLLSASSWAAEPCSKRLVQLDISLASDQRTLSIGQDPSKGVFKNSLCGPVCAAHLLGELLKHEGRTPDLLSLLQSVSDLLPHNPYAVGTFNSELLSALMNQLKKTLPRLKVETTTQGYDYASPIREEDLLSIDGVNTFAIALIVRKKEYLGRISGHFTKDELREGLAAIESGTFEASFPVNEESGWVGHFVWIKEARRSADGQIELLVADPSFRRARWQKMIPFRTSVPEPWDSFRYAPSDAYLKNVILTPKNYSSGKPFTEVRYINRARSLRRQEDGAIASFLGRNASVLLTLNRFKIAR